MAATGPVSVELSSESVAKLVRETRAFSPVLARNLRKQIRAAGETAVVQIRRTLRLATPGGTPLVSGGARDGLANDTKVSVLAGQRMQGVRIKTSAAKLPAALQAVAKAYNKASWRHPEWGRNQWVTQSGRPYFGSTIKKDLPAMRGAIATALAETIKEVRTE